LLKISNSQQLQRATTSLPDCYTTTPLLLHYNLSSFDDKTQVFSQKQI